MMRALRRSKDPTASPPYLSHFKLRSSPFAAGGGPAFFYADPERAQTLNMLQHLTQYSEELLLVTGIAGSGKTSLLEQYLQRADDDWKVCRINAAEVTDPGNLFLLAARCFGLHTDGVASEGLLAALREHLNQLQQSMLPVLVVDDAQGLSDDALEIVVRLAELPGDSGKLVRTILFAEPAISQRLAGERFTASPKPHLLELHPLDEAQTAAYMQHRLVAAGHPGGVLFSARELKRIHKASQGWPGQINLAAHEVLMDRLRAERPSRLKTVYYVLAAGVLVGGAYLLLREHVAAPVVSQPPLPQPAASPVVTPSQPVVRNNEKPRAVQTALVVRSGETVQITCAAPATAAVPAQPTPTSPFVQEAPASMPAPPVSEVDGETEGGAIVKPPAEEAADRAPPAAETVPPVATGVEPITEPAPTPSAAPEAVSAPSAPSTPATPSAPAPALAPSEGSAAAPVVPEPVAAAPIVERIEPEPILASRVRQTVILHGRGFTADSRVTLSWDGRQKTLVGDQVEVLDGNRIAVRIATGTRTEAWSVTVSGAQGQMSAPFDFKVTMAPPAPPRPVVAAPDTGFRDVAWLEGRDPQRYTVQLVGATTLEAINSHLTGHRPAGELALFTTQRDGMPWFVVVWGDFPDRPAAQRAVGGLPPALRRSEPWIRDFAAVQRELAASPATSR